MRQWTFFAGMMALVWSGCALLDRYDYSQYDPTGGHEASGGAAGSGGLASTTSSSSSSSSSSGSGSAGTGGMGGNNLAPCPSTGPSYTAEMCDNGVDDDCVPNGDCHVAAALQGIFGDIEHQQVKAISSAPDGSLLIGGEYAGMPTFVAGKPLTKPTSGFSSFAARINTQGSATWAKMTELNGATLGVAPADNGIFTIGRFAATGGATKLSARRIAIDFDAPDWRHDFGSVDDSHPANIISKGGPTDPVYISGSVSGAVGMTSLCSNFIDSASAGTNAFVFKLKPANGTCDWGFTVDGGVVTSMTVTSSLIIIGGYYFSSDILKLNGAKPPPAGTIGAFIAAYDAVTPTTPLWLHTYVIEETAGIATFVDSASDESNTYVIGTLLGSIATEDGKTLSAPDADGTVMAFRNSDGAYLWGSRIGGIGTQVPLSIATTSDGLYIAGFHNNSMTMSPQGMAIEANKDDGPLCVGKFRCMFLLNWTLDGTAKWSREFGSSEAATNPTVLLTATTNHLWLATSRNSAVNFGLNEVTSAGGQDVMFAKFLWSDLP